jgi:hypothetical protein
VKAFSEENALRILTPGRAAHWLLVERIDLVHRALASSRGRAVELFDNRIVQDTLFRIRRIHPHRGITVSMARGSSISQNFPDLPAIKKSSQQRGKVVSGNVRECPTF